MTPIKILLIDDHSVMRMGLAALLGTQKDLQIVGDAGDGETGIRKALKLRPDVVIMDLMMPVMDGVATTRELLAKMPEAKVLILTTFGSSDGIAHALESGAKGAIMKTADLAELLDAIRAIARGERSVAPEIEQILTEDPPVPELSPRQTDIMKSVIRGLTNEDIAKQLGISLPMVKEHVKALFAKIGAANADNNSKVPTLLTLKTLPAQRARNTATRRPASCHRAWSCPRSPPNAGKDSRAPNGESLQRPR